MGYEREIIDLIVEYISYRSDLEDTIKSKHYQRSTEIKMNLIKCIGILKEKMNSWGIVFGFVPNYINIEYSLNKYCLKEYGVSIYENDFEIQINRRFNLNNLDL